MYLNMIFIPLCFINGDCCDLFTSDISIYHTYMIYKHPFWHLSSNIFLLFFFYWPPTPHTLFKQCNWNMPGVNSLRILPENQLPHTSIISSIFYTENYSFMMFIIFANKYSTYIKWSCACEQCLYLWIS